uniref:Uncharacterized protein n=1 Tax=viral metagenome TaxID=1070528 RepID=A0A6C0CZH8_9ZZZZ
MSGFIDKAENFGKDLGRDIKRASEDAFDFTKERVLHPSMIGSDFKKMGRSIKKTGSDVYNVGENVVDYTKKVVHDPRILSNDVIGVTDRTLIDIINHRDLRFMIYTGVLYFILSHKSFRSASEKIFKSIPIVGRLYIFPHLMNTAIFLSLLFVVKMSLDSYVKTGLMDLEKLIPAIVTRPIIPAPTPPVKGWECKKDGTGGCKYVDGGFFDSRDQCEGNCGYD